jgi:hypothetical protein
LRLDERIDLHRRLWRGELQRPILGFFYKKPQPRRRTGPRFPGVDIDTPADDVVTKYTNALSNAEDRLDERIPYAPLNYGTSFLPVLAGAEYKHNGGTAWCLPTGLRTEQLHIPELDRDRPIWRSYEEKMRALVAARIPQALIDAQPPPGAMEMLLGLVGPEQLMLDMFDTPAAVREKARDCTRLCKQVFEATREILREPDGAVGFGVYVPGRSSMWTEDGLAMIGPRQFDEFFREPIQDMAGYFETSFLHTHSAGWANYELLSEIEELDGVELSNDPNGPPLEEIVQAGVRLQARGKVVMFSNWEHPLSEPEVDYILDNADPGRSVITLTVQDADEARHYLAKVERRFGQG